MDRLKVISSLLMGLGLTVIAIAFGADLFGLGRQGNFGIKQTLMGLAGAVAGMLGIVLALPATRRILGDRSMVGPARERLESPGGLLLLALWAGLMTGLGDTMLDQAIALVNNQHSSLIPSAIWMGPLSAMLTLTLPGLILAGVALRWPRRISLGLGLWVILFFALSDWLLLVPPLETYAVVILAAGLALQCARLLATRPDILWGVIQFPLGSLVAATRMGQRLRRFYPAGQAARLAVPATLPSMLSVFGSVALITGSVQAYQVAEERWVWHPGPPPSGSAPNILFIVLDTARAEP